MHDCTCHSHNGFLVGSGQSEQLESSVLLTEDERSVSLDLPVSVSALFEFELTESQLEEQHRRFLNGS